jgi:hypothetical protein
MKWDKLDSRIRRRGLLLDRERRRVDYDLAVAPNLFE